MIRYQRVGEHIVLIDEDGIALPFCMCDGWWCWWGRHSKPAPTREQQTLEEIHELGAVEGVFY
jgi:hypothetical protein